MSRFLKVTGRPTARLRGARRAIEERAASSLVASRNPVLDERAAAALRGKAAGLREAARVVAALENGTALPKRIEKTGLAA